MQALYSVVDAVPHKRIIHVFGSAGGGRDVARRPVLGSLVGTRADLAIITNEDPYDEPPMDIIEQIAEGVRSVGKLKEGVTYFKVKDRRDAIAQALRFAQPEDLVLITGKACEQWIMGPLGTKKAWDDRRVVREELGKAGYLSTKVVYNPDL
jgi:UDP-N-acetylmuramoyl-L-alanyl-D-glutamate--2,6-diaminopimelate ligase